HPELDGMLVVPEAIADDRRGPGGDGRAAEVVILVFAFDGPVWCEHVFQAGADRITVAAIADSRKGHRRAADTHTDVVVAAPGVTALGVEQCRAPGVAEPTGDRTKLIGIGGHQSAAREQHAATAVAGQPAVLSLCPDHPVRRELIVEAALRAAEESAVAVLQAGATRERASDMAANVEAGPVVDHLGRRIHGSFGVGARRNIGCECGSRECDANGCAEQKFLHRNSPLLASLRSINKVAPIWLLRGIAGA